MLAAAECHNYMNGQCLPDVRFLRVLEFIKGWQSLLESILAISVKSYNNICALCLRTSLLGIFQRKESKIWKK